MKKARGLALALLIIFTSPAIIHAGSSRTDAIEIKGTDGKYEVTVPVSRLVMTIPRGGFSQGDNKQGISPSASPRYFYFEDTLAKVIISGWFEPEQRFQGVSAFWENETKAWKKAGLPEPKDVSFGRIGNWETIVYDMPFPAGSNSHIRAHWLQSGTWIDIHLSVTSSGPSHELRAKLRSLLTSIDVREKI